jgi:hypothetical protein
MKRLLPGRVELGVLLTLALVATLAASLMSRADVALFLVSMPLFFVATLMGLRRSGQLAGRREPTE